MPRHCLVCKHDQRDEINDALLQSVSSYEIADRFELKPASVKRHRVNHLLPSIAGARNRREQLAFRAPVKAVLAEANRPLNLLEQVDDLYERAKGLLDKAEAAEKFGPATSAIRECTRLVELLARLQGDLTNGTTLTTNIVITSTPEWLLVRERLLEALRPHPQACQAVGLALAELEPGPEPSDDISDDRPQNGS